jgi:hypothetical protein
LSVDGLLLLTTVALVKPRGTSSRRTRFAVWLGFWLGIAVSLAANIAAAPSLSWQPIVVAGWPPVALLLSVELLDHRHRARESSESQPELQAEILGAGESPESGKTITLAPLSRVTRPARRPRAEDVMWAHFQHERAGDRRGLRRFPGGGSRDEPVSQVAHRLGGTTEILWDRLAVTAC